MIALAVAEAYLGIAGLTDASERAFCSRREGVAIVGGVREGGEKRRYKSAICAGMWPKSGSQRLSAPGRREWRAKSSMPAVLNN